MTNLISHLRFCIIKRGFAFKVIIKAVFRNQEQVLSTEEPSLVIWEKNLKRTLYLIWRWKEYAQIISLLSSPNFSKRLAIWKTHSYQEIPSDKLKEVMLWNKCSLAMSRLQTLTLKAQCQTFKRRLVKSLTSDRTQW